ncbi:hypothetical protein D3C85_999770 [compost metagenome]
MAENFAFEQVLRQAAAVQGDELFGVAATEIMQAACNQFLAGAGLAFDQHVGRGIGNVGDQFPQVLHGRRATDDPPFEGVALGQLPTQRRDFSRQAALLQGAAGDVHQAFGGEGFLHEVVGAVAHGLHRHGNIAVASDQHHRQAAVAGLEAFQQGQAVDAGQADVADDDAGEVFAQRLQGFFGAADADAGDVFQGQGLLATQ